MKKTRQECLFEEEKKTHKTIHEKNLDCPNQRNKHTQQFRYIDFFDVKGIIAFLNVFFFHSIRVSFERKKKIESVCWFLLLCALYRSFSLHEAQKKKIIELE